MSNINSPSSNLKEEKSYVLDGVDGLIYDDLQRLKFIYSVKDNTGKRRYKRVTVDCSKGKDDLFTDRQKYDLLSPYISYVVYYDANAFSIFKQKDKVPILCVKDAISLIEGLYKIEKGTTISLADYYGIKTTTKKYQRKEK